MHIYSSIYHSPWVRQHLLIYNFFLSAIFQMNLGQQVPLGFLPPLVPEEDFSGYVAQIFYELDAHS